MIYIFDLDDTLYDERQYVESGFRAVAKMGQQQWNLDPHSAFASLISCLEKNGRGRVFNDWLSPFGLDSKANIQKCVTTYRLHKPNIVVPPAHIEVLEALPQPLYLVTDGNKIVQKNKVDALGIAPYFKRIFITHRFGVKHAKPSTHCFELIKNAESCEWQDMVYVGDNPAKDFVNLNRLGVQSVRVMTGMHKAVRKSEQFEAKHEIEHLSELLHLRGN